MWIKRGRIIDYFDETFLTAVAEWKAWKLFGLPHGGGRMAERPIVVQAIQIIEEERAYYERRKTERGNGGSRGAKGRS